jgi:tetratricopeptide (TPR) repeat protein
VSRVAMRGVAKSVPETNREHPNSGCDGSDESPMKPGRMPPEQVGPFAQLVADARARLRLSERDLAALVTESAWQLAKNKTTVHHSAISRWEAGTIAQPRIRPWIAHALQGKGLDISVRDLDTAASAQRTARRRLPAPLSPVQASDVERRQFLIAGGAVAASALSRAIFATKMPHAIDETDLRLERLNQQVHNAWRLRQTSKYDELGALLPQLLYGLNAALARTSSESDIRRLVPMTVHAYNAASSLLRRLGYGELAGIAADRALRHASDIGDPLLQASATYRLANVLLSAQAANDAGEVSLTAASSLEPHLKNSADYLAMWGALLLTASVAAAREQRSSQAWSLLGQARTAAVLLGSDYMHLNAIFGPTNVAIHFVEVASDLGDNASTIAHGRAIQPESLPADLLERRSALLINIASAHHRQGDVETALATILDAERLAPQEIRFHHKARALVSELLRTTSTAPDGLRALAKRVGLD